MNMNSGAFVYSISYNPLLSLFLAPVALDFAIGSSSGWLLCSFERPSSFLNTYLLSAEHKMFHFHLVLLLHPLTQPFLQGALSPLLEDAVEKLRSGSWVCSHWIFIAVNSWEIHVGNNMCMCVCSCVYVCIYILKKRTYVYLQFQPTTYKIMLQSFPLSPQHLFFVIPVYDSEKQGSHCPQCIFLFPQS